MTESRPRRAGRNLDGIEVELVEDRGQNLPRGRVGGNDRSPIQPEPEQVLTDHLSAKRMERSDKQLLRHRSLPPLA